jgi:hypothetical protein
MALEIIGQELVGEALEGRVLAGRRRGGTVSGAAGRYEKRENSGQKRDSANAHDASLSHTSVPPPDSAMLPVPVICVPTYS